ncbi:LURP-one-related/scramblase family protein [Paraliobacillus sediminis]|uniref:LURP-one-related/scramblase family protein n=1 Tax=Paraliobacillus sediminis TaxID=1885916 RepID=UPI000E3CF29F|nr:LURP-one-related family protein [Paraliobacillus sediminis]
MSKLYIKQKVFSLGGNFTVKNEFEQDKYLIKGSFLSIPKTFTIKDTSDNEIGTITKKVFSFLPTFFVEVNGEEVVTIKKEFSFFKSRYQIEGRGIEVHGDWWDKKFEVVSHGEVVGQVNEKWFTWGDSYEVGVKDESLEHIIISLVIAIDFVKQEENSAAASAGN